MRPASMALGEILQDRGTATVVRANVQLAGLRYLNAGFGVASNLALAIGLGPSAYGFLITLIAAQSAASWISQWGTDRVIVRAVTAMEQDAASQSLATVAIWRWIACPTVSAVLIGIIVWSRGGLSASEGTAAGLVWLSSLGAFATVAIPVGQGLGHVKTMVWTSQVNGLAWSVTATVVGLLSPSLVAGAAAFLVSGVLTASAYLCSLRSMGLQLALSGHGRGCSALVEMLRGGAGPGVALMALVIPWRLAPAAIGWAAPPATAGLVIAAMKFWEQLAVPAVSLSSFRVRRVALGTHDYLVRSVSAILLVTAAATLPGALFSIVYSSLLLGNDYEALGRGIIGGSGFAVAVAVSQAYAPLALVGGQSVPAFRVGLGMIVSLCLAAGIVRWTDDPVYALLGFSLTLGMGTLGAILGQRTFRRRPIVAAAIAAGTVQVALTALALVIVQ